ncbi:hypothetical protein C3Z09_21400 [Lelliottia aquatilis]|nr:hypothetical protein C3Z09_21400 [Lelliottia aquatilis]
MQLTLLRILLDKIRFPHGVATGLITLRDRRFAYIALLILIVPSGSALAASPYCTTTAPPSNATVPVRLAPNRSTAGPAYPTLVSVMIPSSYMSCTGAPPNQTFWIGARSIQPGKRGSVSVFNSPRFITRTDVRATTDGANDAGHKVSIGQLPPLDLADNGDPLFVGARIVTPASISCSGATSGTTVGTASDAQGGGIALLACKTNPDGTVWVSRSASLAEIYQASPDGAVGYVGNQGSDNVALYLNGDASPGIGIVTASVGVIVSTSLHDIKSLLDASPTPATTQCEGNYISRNPLFSGLCNTVFATNGHIYFGSQPTEPSVCSVSIPTGTSVTWANPVESNAFSGVGGAIAPTQITTIELRCTGSEVSKLATIVLNARGTPAVAEPTEFASSNASVNYRLNVRTTNKTVAPNSTTSLTSADGVTYTDGGAVAIGSVDLSVTPVAARPAAIPGRADTRITLDVYAAL